jgi:hypothetical protein
LIIPSSRQVVNAKLLFKKVPEDEVKNSPYDIDLAQKDWQDDDTTSLMRVRKHSCTIIKVHISSLKENHRYKLVWVLN